MLQSNHTKNNIMNNVTPMSPKDIENDLENIIPEFVITAVNNILKRKYRPNNTYVALKQNEIIKEIQSINPDVSRAQIFDNKWFDFESLFEKAGWKVEYDKPGYNETYEAHFTFTPKKKRKS